MEKEEEEEEEERKQPTADEKSCQGEKSEEEVVKVVSVFRWLPLLRPRRDAPNWLSSPQWRPLAANSDHFTSVT